MEESPVKALLQRLRDMGGLADNEESRQWLQDMEAYLDRPAAPAAPPECECNGGPPCDCPDCEHEDCAYKKRRNVEPAPAQTGLREALYRVEVGGDGLLVVGPDGEQWDCSEEDGIEALVAALNARPATPASDGLQEALRSLDDLSADLGRYIEAKKRFDAHSDEFTSDDWRQIDRFDLGVWKGYFDMARAALAREQATEGANDA